MKKYLIVLIFFFLKCTTSLKITSPLFYKSKTSNNIQKFIQDNQKIGIILKFSKNIKNKNYIREELKKLENKDLSYYDITLLKKKESSILTKKKINIILTINFKERITNCNDNFFNIIYNIQLIFENIKEKKNFQTSISPVYKSSKKVKKCKSIAKKLGYSAEQYSINEIKKYIIPKLITKKINFFLDYENNKIKRKLKLSYKKFKKGNYKESFKILQSMENKNIWQVDANLANLYFLQGNYQKALFFYEKVLKNKKIRKKNRKYFLDIKKEIFETTKK